MKNLFAAILIIISSAAGSAQNKKAFDNYRVKVDNSILKVFDLNGKQIFSKKFNDPRSFNSDLDGDGINEVIVEDTFNKGLNTYYTLYIYNCIDTFGPADSVASGLTAPYITNSEDIGGPVIVAGNPKFDYLNKDTADIFVPINCWKYENGELFNVNDEVYNLFIGENEDIIDFIDSYFESEGKSCGSSNSVKAAIASVYVNYINAGEKILAEHFIEKYYLCPDLSGFKKIIEALL